MNMAAAVSCIWVSMRTVTVRFSKRDTRVVGDGTTYRIITFRNGDGKGVCRQTVITVDDAEVEDKRLLAYFPGHPSQDGCQLIRTGVSALAQSTSSPVDSSTSLESVSIVPNPLSTRSVLFVSLSSSTSIVIFWSSALCLMLLTKK